MLGAVARAQAAGCAQAPQTMQRGVAGVLEPGPPAWLLAGVDHALASSGQPAVQLGLQLALGACSSCASSRLTHALRLLTSHLCLRESKRRQRPSLQQQGAREAALRALTLTLRA